MWITGLIRDGLSSHEGMAEEYTETFEQVHRISPTDLAVLRAWLDRCAIEGAVLGLDVETTGLGTYSPDFKVRTVQLSDGDSAVVIQVEGNEPILRMILQRESLRFVTHSNFDALALKVALGVDLTGRVLDTYILAALLRPKEKHGLKHLTRAVLGDDSLTEGETELQELFKAHAPVKGKNKIAEWGFKHVPIDHPLYVRYAGLDAIMVHRLAAVLLPYCHKMTDLVEREHWLNDQCLNLQHRGIKLDTTRTNNLLTELASQLEAAKTRLEDHWGFPARSPKRVEWLKDHGAKFDTQWKTPKGEVSLCREQIDHLAETHATDSLAAVTGDMQTLSLMSNICSNLKQFQAKVVQGRVHPAIKTLRAITGRMSITNPALQTLKKQDKRLRGLFMADEGYALVACDFDQVEIRVAAGLSDDPVLLGIINDGVDVHSATAEHIFGPGYTPAQRQIAKITNFGSIYGGGAGALSKNAGIPEADARTVVKEWKQTYPTLVRYGKALGFHSTVINPYGRRLPIDPERTYSALNYMVQSTARDLFAEATRRVIGDLDLGDNLWLLVHDELIFQVPAHQAETYAQKIKESMETTFNGVAITAEAEVLGERWSGEG